MVDPRTKEEFYPPINNCLTELTGRQGVRMCRKALCRNHEHLRGGRFHCSIDSIKVHSSKLLGHTVFFFA